MSYKMTEILMAEVEQKLKNLALSDVTEVERQRTKKVLLREKAVLEELYKQETMSLLGHVWNVIKSLFSIINSILSLVAIRLKSLTNKSK